ncbi:hypothetical protein ACXR6G_04710 [Ancylomarina sp. YFZ004]
MKYTNITLGVLAFLGIGALSSCDVNDDFYDEIDAKKAQETADYTFFKDKTLIEDNYKLTEADFALSSDEGVAQYKNFSAYSPAADHLAQILTAKKLYGELATEYSIWFNYYRGHSEAFSNYRNKHEVSAAEYTALGGVVADLGYFTSDVKSDDNANGILSAAYPEAVEGDVQKFISQGAASKSYKFEDISIEAVQKFTLGKEDFKVIVDAVLADDANKHLVNADENLEFYYGANSKYGNFEGRTSKWAAKDEYKDMSEDDLEDLIYARQKEAVMLALKAKFPEATILDSEGNTVTYTVAYSSYDGSTRDNLVRYECIAEGASLDFNRIGSMYINTKHELYMFDGENWLIEDAIYRLLAEDYDAMGDDYGFPGKYDNFDSAMDVDRYMKVLLNNMDKFAADGDTKIIAYKYYTDGVTELRADEYTFTTEMGWYLTPTNVDAKATVAFKDRVWEFVPPIKFIETEKDATETYTLVKADYELVGNGKYGNFDTRAGKDEEDPAVILDKLSKVIKSNFDVALGEVYELSYQYYDGTATQEGILKLEAVADN